MSKISNKHWLIFLEGMLVSLVVRSLFPSFHHLYDVITFEAWAPYVQHVKTVYTTECFCNYPIVGLLMSSGVIDLIGTKGFLFFLSLVDGFNVILMAMILKKLNVSDHLRIAGIIGLLPISWVGGGLWGQIDTIGQTELFIFLLLLMQSLSDHSRKAHLLFSIGTGMLLSVALLTKQLLLFPVLIFGFLTILIWIHQKNHLGQKLLLALAAFSLPIVAADLYLDLNAPYRFSHLERIFLEGSDHVNFISGNGFNVWMLFVSEMYTPSTSSWFLGMSPKIMGVLAVGALSIILFAIYFKRFASTGQHRQIGGFLLIYTLLFLGINLFFTGTHESYLYHFYPFLFIALLLLKAPRYLILITGACSFLYAGFVFGILKQWHLSQYVFMNYTAHRVVFICHFILFLLLIRFLIISSNSNRPHEQI